MIAGKWVELVFVFRIKKRGPARLAILVLFLFQVSLVCAQKKDGDKNGIFLADPTIFYHENLYYLYGTGGINNNNGFVVYTSKDLKSWEGPAGADSGFALKKGNSYGTGRFWAPQVFERNRRFYMAYAANEHIAIASAESPLGPFKQESSLPVSTEKKQIDPFVFTDLDGRSYLYYVVVDSGANRIYVSEMNEDLQSIKNGTDRFCLQATESWENKQNEDWPVTEGPTVIRQKDLYYLLYSANHFKSPDYAVGFAVSSSPLGPWTKFRGGPFLDRTKTGWNGSGHGDLVQTGKGKWFYVFHTHYSNSKTSPRRTAIIKLDFVKDKPPGWLRPVVKPSHFRFLKLKKNK